MNNIVKWPDEDRADLFRETAAQKGVAPGIVEKDFWVCWTLSKLFGYKAFRGKIMFKGGTSLSKVFKLIERFSEDIDLILDWDAITKESPTLDRSIGGQNKFNEQLNQEAQLYLRDIFVPELTNICNAICTPRIDTSNPHNISIRYPAAFNEQYLRPEVLLEIGPLAAWTPNAEYSITPYAAEEFPDKFSFPTCKVMAIKAERTFWEKATILHHEAHRPEESPTPPRYSRHYFDLMMMANSQVKERALADLSLLRDVVDFKDKFYHRGWARYDLAYPGSMKLVPPIRVQNVLKKDYREMHNMFFSQPPTFDEIMDSIQKLEHEINQL